MSIANNKFVHKYKPKTFEKVVLLNRVKQHFPDGKVTKHLLLSGDSGLGKSAVLKVVSENYHSLYVNASKETSIDLLRDGGEIYNHCAEMSFDGRDKLVFLDEIDGVSIQFFEALKGFMDVFENTTFVATTNHIGNIPKAHISRFEVVDFDFKSDLEREEFFIGYRNRLYIIAKSEGISSTKESISSFAKRFFPDFRDGLQCLQTLKENGVTEITEEVVIRDSFKHKDLYNYILSGNPTDTEAIHTIVTGITNPKLCISVFDKEFFDYVKLNKPERLVKCGNAIIQICRHSEMINNRIDPMLVLKSMVFSLVNCMR